MNRRSLFSAFLLTILPRPSYAGLIENIFSKGKSWDVIVVGAGAAGLSAAVEAADNRRFCASIGKSAGNRRKYFNLRRLLCLGR